MDYKEKMLNATKYIGGTILAFGIITFLIGFFATDSSVLTPMGIGAVVGAVFVFLIGIFFVAAEEMLEKAYRGVEPYRTK
ncbi:hypothetical protein A8F95_20275 [Bacillus wudalianchiensis]|uniref:Uncharacterized protein n=2 Tax=Pseudobacillus wudalianchiensis TaxID=1743143 RepID=A0A1B9B6K5_9BACI|nr:hypothetical protein A8F95_20275 [Bacillus wudalianchiensis]